MDIKTKIKIKSIKLNLFFYKLFTKPKLLLMSGNSYIELEILKQKKYEIGRTGKADNFIQIRSETVSKNHANIIKKGVDFFIIDLFSSNGTFLNGERLTPDVLYLLLDEDLILLGDIELKFYRKSK